MQSVSLQVTAYGQRNFRVWVSSDVISLPRGLMRLGHFIILAPQGHDDWWFDGATHAQADQSMAEMLRLIGEGRARSYLEQTVTPEGFVKYSTPQRLGVDHHRRFAKGCCEAWIGSDVDARATLEDAHRIYMKDHLESAVDGLDRSWCLDYAKAVKKLLTAIDEGKARALLEQWLLEHVDENRLEKVLAAQHSNV